MSVPIELSRFYSGIAVQQSTANNFLPPPFLKFSNSNNTPRRRSSTDSIPCTPCTPAVGSSSCYCLGFAPRSPAAWRVAAASHAASSSVAAEKAVAGEPFAVAAATLGLGARTSSRTRARQRAGRARRLAASSPARVAARWSCSPRSRALRLTSPPFNTASSTAGNNPPGSPPSCIAALSNEHVQRARPTSTSNEHVLRDELHAEFRPAALDEGTLT